MTVYLDEVKARFEQLRLVRSEKIIPCTEREIQMLEQQLGLPLPGAYKEFLLWMGHGAGGFMRGSDCFYEHLPHLRAWTIELLWENGYVEPLPGDAFVFYMHQGYLFYFVRVGEGDDPPVYFYSEAMETPAFIIEHPHLADFLNYQIEVKVRYRADHLARLAEAEKNNPKRAKELKDLSRRLGDDF
jgi:SMI1 / KNR4 family (SUKH-1)